MWPIYLLLVVLFFIAVVLATFAGVGWLFYINEHNVRLDLEEDLMDRSHLR